MRGLVPVWTPRSHRLFNPPAIISHILIQPYQFLYINQNQVRKSMARIKLVLREREIAAQQRAAAAMAEAGAQGEGQQQGQSQA